MWVHILEQEPVPISQCRNLEPTLCIQHQFLQESQCVH